MKKNFSKTAGVITLALAGSGLQNVAQAAIQVQLDGQPLATSTRPIRRNGRTLVPMRDIFEALGATVNYNGLTRGIIAQRGTTRVNLQINNANAQVNGRTIRLETAPLVRGGSTFVPLRFVSEALGANVTWNGARQLVSIRSGVAGGVARRPGQAVGGVRSISVPAGVVVPVTLDSEISSATANVGDTFTATVRSQRLGDSEFPAGSKIEGVVSEVQRRQGENPGVLDLDFRTVILPDGSRHPLRGELISLDNSSVTSTQQGRIVAKSNSSKNDKLKIIGIGAGAGYLIGKVLLKKDGLLSAVLGAAGGYLYSQQKDKNRAAEATLKAGTELGVKLNNNIAYADTTGYYDDRATYFRM